VFLLGTAVSLLCDERKKSLSEDLQLPCPDTSSDCTWYRVVGDFSTPIERRFPQDSNGNIILFGNDEYSFGKFFVNTTSNISQCYEVCPTNMDNSKLYCSE